ncbi:MAG: IS256 family transposase [Firmicutes bacterium]|nr:IS256 family transposase [Bacillota bacterium]
MNNDFINSLNLVFNDSNNDVINNLYNNMSTYQKSLFDSFKSNTSLLENYSLNDLIYDFDKNFIESILNLELDLYLNTCKELGIDNKRNGFTKDIDLTIGDRKIIFNRPRLRHENDFDSSLIPKRTRVLKDLYDNIILLYSKNNSVNDIKDILSKMFGINVSSAFISNLTQELSTDVLNWRNKQLNKCYFCVNIDCTYITIRDNKSLNSHKIPVYVAVGTNLLGIKEIIGLYLGNEDENKNIIDNLYSTDIAESKTFWLTVFNDLKDRGVEKILYIVSDGLPGIDAAIKSEFPDAFYQRCIVHLVRNLKTYTNKSNCKEIINDFKNIYSASSKEMAIINKDYFLDKYKDNKTIIKHVNEYLDYIMPLFDLPINIRNYIYTNNIVESVNSKIKRGFYGRGALPNVQSALNIVYLNISDLENKWNNKHVSNWDNIYNELIKVHYNDIKNYL